MTLMTGAPGHLNGAAQSLHRGPCGNVAEDLPQALLEAVAVRQVVVPEVVDIALAAVVRGHRSSGADRERTTRPWLSPPPSRATGRACRLRRRVSRGPGGGGRRC